MPTLQDKLNFFNKEAVAIISQIEFVEQSFILPAMYKSNNAYIDEIIPRINSIDEAQSNLDNVLKLLRNKSDELSTLYSSMEYKHIPDIYNNIDYQSEEGECIQYILEIIDSGETAREKIKKDFRNSYLEAECIIKQETNDGVFYSTLYYDEVKLTSFIDACLDIHFNQNLYNLENAISSLEYYIKLFTLIKTNEHTNIYRQAFIQLIALLDNTVFDCFKIMFDKDFFLQLKYFNDGSFKFSELAEYNNFSDFKDYVINQKLKRCYLRNLLMIAKNQNSSLFDIDGATNYPFIIEMVNRRNCHIHNNGVADEIYISSEKGNSFNIYNKNIGDYLYVDKKYFNQAYKLCSQFITNLVKAFDWR